MNKESDNLLWSLDLLANQGKDHRVHDRVINSCLSESYCLGDITIPQAKAIKTIAPYISGMIFTKKFFNRVLTILIDELFGVKTDQDVPRME